jgi:hypothetical protein
MYDAGIECVWIDVVVVHKLHDLLLPMLVVPKQECATLAPPI